MKEADELKTKLLFYNARAVRFRGNEISQKNAFRLDNSFLSSFFLSAATYKLRAEMHQKGA